MASQALLQPHLVVLDSRRVTTAAGDHSHVLCLPGFLLLCSRQGWWVMCGGGDAHARL